jgi:hypothetical protein
VYKVSTITYFLPKISTTDFSDYSPTWSLGIGRPNKT